MHLQQVDVWRYHCNGLHACRHYAFLVMECAHVEVVEDAIGEDANADDEVWRGKTAHQVICGRLET